MDRQPIWGILGGWAKPHRAVSYLSICSVLRGEERGFARPEGADPLLEDGNYNWVALTLGYGTNQTFLLPWLTHPWYLQLRRWSKDGLFRPWAGATANRTSRLCLQGHLLITPPHTHTLFALHFAIVTPRVKTDQLPETFGIHLLSIDCLHHFYCVVSSSEAVIAEI